MQHKVTTVCLARGGIEQIERRTYEGYSASMTNHFEQVYPQFSISIAFCLTCRDPRSLDRLISTVIEPSCLVAPPSAMDRGLLADDNATDKGVHAYSR